MSRSHGYKVNLGNPHERIDLGKTIHPTGGVCAVAFRFGRELTQFVASPSQRRKIKKGRGAISITPKMISRAAFWCQLGSSPRPR